MITIGLEQIKDCDHCSRTYGTLGCCTTVNNQWVYSCTEGQKEYIIDRVLEIIDGCKFSDDSEIYPYDGIMWNNRALEQAKQEILRLKEGEQE